MHSDLLTFDPIRAGLLSSCNSDIEGSGPKWDEIAGRNGFGPNRKLGCEEAISAEKED
jgi:hypothetical protein